MAASGGITGVHAGNMVNCYAIGDTSSDTFSYYVGALAGWVTGIGNLYNSYFNTDSSQTIATQTVNPVVPAGWLVGPGINDEGEPYSGSISYQVEGVTASALANESFATKLNDNFSVFPINLAIDHPGVILNRWTLADAAVLPTGEAATVIYVKPDIQLPVAQPNYVDGLYYGRSTDGVLILTLTIQDGDISAVNAGDEYTDAIAAIIDTQGTDTLDTSTEAMQRLKSAVDIALQKAKSGDTTGYGKVDPSIFAGGSGTKASPYRIATEIQLRAFAAAVNADEDFAGKFIELTADITLTQPWIPAGSSTPHPFSGSFDGNGHTISELTIGSAEKPAGYQYAGLFAYIENGTVTDLILKNVDISTATSGSSRIYAGALTGFVDQSVYTGGSATGSAGYIDNVTVTGKLSISSNSGAAYVAGLAASVIRGTITNCTVDVNITASSQAAWVYAGGLTGVFARAGIMNNRISGSITSSAPLNKTAIGGLGGFHSGVSYNNFADIALVSTGSTGDVGALAGRNTGIGLMLPGYFNNTRVQKAGNTEFPGVGVGSIVVGEQDGKGAVQGLAGKTGAQISAGDVTALLNTGIADKATLAQAAALLASWKVSLPPDLKLFAWKQASGTPVLNPTSNSGGSNNSGRNTSPTPSTPTPTPPTEQTKGSFSDVRTSDWYHDAVTYAVKKGLFEGVSENQFAPNSSMTRAMLVTVLNRAAGKPNGNSAVGFHDVPTDAWYAEPMAWAVEHGIVQGVSATDFNPSGEITREQIAAMLYRYAQFLNLDMTAKGTLSQYTDHTSTSSWAKEAMEWAIGNGFLTGKGNAILDPLGTATRAEVATILQRFLERLPAS